MLQRVTTSKDTTDTKGSRTEVSVELRRGQCTRLKPEQSYTGKFVSFMKISSLASQAGCAVLEGAEVVKSQVCEPQRSQPSRKPTRRFTEE